LARDHPLLLGLFIVMSLFIVAVNLITDIRVRHARSTDAPA
jgi:ABC-type dipeptide/oligopeptide/nickel transport system permease component